MRRALHVWIPKTAGTSIWRACRRKIKGRWINPKRDGHRYNVSDYPFVTFEHGGIPALVAEGYLLQHDVDSRLVFCFIRNPWDRLVSCAAHEVRRFPDRQIDSVLAGYHRHIASGQRRPLVAHGVRKLNPSVDWLDGDDGRPIVQVVGRFEELADHWRIICGMLEWPKIRLAHYNPSPHMHYTSYFDSERRDAVAAYYADDIAMGGYRFGKPALSSEIIIR